MTWNTFAKTFLQLLISLWKRCGGLFLCAYRDEKGDIQLCCSSSELRNQLINPEGFSYLRQHLTGSDRTPCQVIVTSPGQQDLEPAKAKRTKAASRTLKSADSHWEKMSSTFPAGAAVAYCLTETAEPHQWSSACTATALTDEYLQQLICSLSVNSGEQLTLHAPSAPSNPQDRCSASRPRGASLKRKDPVPHAPARPKLTKSQSVQAPIAEAATRLWLNLTLNSEAFLIPLSPGAWALPDYNMVTHKLMKRPVRVTQTEGSFECTCNVYRLSPCEARQCIHSNMVLQNAAKMPQAQQRQSSDVVVRIGPNKILQAAFSAPWYWVSDGSSDIFVQQLDATTFKCAHASHGSFCADIQQVKQYLEGATGASNPADPDPCDDATEEAADADDEPEPMAATSGVRYVYPPTDDQLAAMHQLLRDGPPRCLQPQLPSSPCHCGQMYTPAGYVVVNPQCVLYQPAPQYATAIELQELRCPNQHSLCTRIYDGQKHAIFAYSRDSCIAERLLYRYMDDLVTHGLTVDAYVKSLRMDFERYNPQPAISFMSVTLFRRMYYAFGSRLQHAWCFTCPTCLDCPDILIGDATAATMQKRFYVGTPITAVDDGLAAKPRCQSRAARCCCTRPIQQLFQSMASELVGDLSPPDALARLIAACPVLAEFENFQLEEFASHIAAVAHGLPLPSRKAIASCLKDLASESPVCAYLPPGIVEACQSMLRPSPGGHSFSQGEVRLLSKSAPLLFGMLEALQQGQLPNQPLAGPLVSLLDHLVSRAETCWSGASIGPVCMAAAPPSCLSDACLRSGICSGLPVIRHRPRYDLEHAVDASSCRHAFDRGSGGSHRTGGIFTWFCKHMVCYAFFLIPGAEGRNEPFSFLTTHFKHAPKVVVYDFACALQEYCLNREPAFFKNTRFLVDKFHWHNHQACARSYNASLYDDVSFLNTQIAEQCNSALIKIRASVGQMTQAHFMFTVRLFLDVWNRRKIKLVEIYQQS